MFHKLKAVEPQDNFILYATFENGESRYYDINPLFSKWGMFDNLKTINGLYNQVKVDKGGYGISWNDDIDISCDELWINGYFADKCLNNG